MSSWSQRRKLIYVILAVIVLVGAIGIPVFVVVYDAPTSVDGIRNGNEQGIDCGGSCERLCQTSFLTPSIAWTRFEEIAPGLYNLATYIINPNTDAEARDVPYHIALYDDRGVLITDVEGTVTIPPHRNVIAFKSAVNVGKRIPAKGLFEFSGAPIWAKKEDGLKSLVIGKKDYVEDDLGSSLTVEIRNASVYPISGVAVYAILYDGQGNALGFSRTILDELQAQQTSSAPFTWPVSHGGKVVTIEILPVQE